jgi:hypothetical protein
MCESARYPHMVTANPHKLAELSAKLLLLCSGGYRTARPARLSRAQGRPADVALSPETISQDAEHRPTGGVQATDVWRQIRPK